MSVLAASLAGWPLLGATSVFGLIGFAVVYRNRPDDQ